MNIVQSIVRVPVPKFEEARDSMESALPPPSKCNQMSTDSGMETINVRKYR